MTPSRTAGMVLPMPPQSLFVVAVIGLLAGFAARWLLGRRGSSFASLGLGLAGATLGAIAAELLRLPMGSLLPFAAASLCGATVLLAVRALAPRR